MKKWTATIVHAPDDVSFTGQTPHAKKLRGQKQRTDGDTTKVFAKK